MASEKTLAIVLRVIEFSETSCVVTLFTEDFGKVSALAKGARRPKGPFESALDLLAVVRIVFLHNSSEALDLLTEARLVRRFRAAARDLTRLYAGYYVAELLSELTSEGDSQRELFQAADLALQGLEGNDEPAAVILRFELAALRHLGHGPGVTECVECGGEIGSSGRISFGLLAGGVMCSRCRVGKRQVVNLSRGAVETLRTFQARPETTLDLPAAVRGEVRGLMNQYVCVLLGQRPKLHPYLAALTR